MMSLKDCNGIEYLWQGDAKYWQDRSPVLFPIVGRMTDDHCFCYGQSCKLELHGFAQTKDFTVVKIQEDAVTLELRSDALTKQQYPFEFTLHINYTLKENAVNICCSVINLDERTMPFGVGVHPGFNVPLTEDEHFEDYVLEFVKSCQPDIIGFTEQGFANGCDRLYPLQDGKYIPLQHSLFDDDGFMLKNMCREVILRSRVSGQGVKVSFPEMPYVVFWHAPKTDAPYVCIEPWSSLPARQDIVEELTWKSDMIQLLVHDTYVANWSITILNYKDNENQMNTCDIIN